MSPDSIFAALSDPKRRDILDLLRDAGPVNAGDIAARFDQVSRPGISRHLRLLRECGLVKSLPRGREHLYALDPTALLNLREGWLSTFSHNHTASLKALRRTVEGDQS